MNVFSLRLPTLFFFAPEIDRSEDKPAKRTRKKQVLIQFVLCCIMLGPAMRTIGHTCSQRTDARSFPLVRAERTEQRHPSRKDIIKNVILLPVALPALWGAVQQPAQADGVPAAPEVVVPPPPKVKAFIARDFFFQYNPAAFKLIQDPKDFDPSPGIGNIYFTC